MMGRFGGSQAGNGSVVSDIRTNSLIVSATDETHAVVAKVLESIDTEVKVENSTFVVSLKNARADLVANLLTQTFGGRTGTGTNTGTNANRTNTNNTNNTQAVGPVRAEESVRMYSLMAAMTSHLRIQTAMVATY